MHVHTYIHTYTHTYTHMYNMNYMNVLGRLINMIPGNVDREKMIISHTHTHTHTHIQKQLHHFRYLSRVIFGFRNTYIHTYR